MLERYKYTGDNIGTKLEKGKVYTFRKESPNIYRAYPNDSEGFVEITKDEFQTHKNEYGTLERV